MPDARLCGRRSGTGAVLLPGGEAHHPFEAHARRTVAQHAGASSRAPHAALLVTPVSHAHDRGWLQNSVEEVLQAVRVARVVRVVDVELEM